MKCNRCSQGSADDYGNEAEEDYLKLVDWTGRSIRDDKKGAIPQSLMPIMQRLGVDLETWLVSIIQYNKHYFSVLGVLNKVREFARTQGKAWCRGQGFCGQTYTSVRVEPAWKAEEGVS
ncbi:MAG: hypothetical protein ABW076_14575 [Candidatus Thiodiazotropha sp.]